MTERTTQVLALFIFAAAHFHATAEGAPVEHVDLYPFPVEGGLSATPDGPDSYRYAGWPANGKFFSWEDELLLVFAYVPAASEASDSYHATGEGNSYLWSTRSFDGGKTWTDSAQQGAGLIAPHDAITLTDPIDFKHSDLALMIQMTGSQQGPSRLLYSTDRGRSWYGFYQLDLPGGFDPIAARSDYIIEDSSTLRLLSSAGHEKDEDGTSPHQWITSDGGLNWKLLGPTGLYTPDLEQWEWSIMPATVKLSDGTLVQAARTKGSGRPFRNYHPIHRSTDGGKTWNLTSHVFLEDVQRSGKGYHTPSDLDLIPGTDTLVCTYVDRGSPGRLLAKLSIDSGLSWSEEIILREDAGNHDIGYPETVFRADGKAVTVAYWNLKDDPKAWSKHHNPRFLAFAIWDPKLFLDK
ncbi:sialidase family protein [Pelagicoccus enzymogenes]|uniref:sialidase family protein n=1 Tax=Pelagicoccus enzymogenes TaxID=2773457 RepID=UPI00280DB91C|nr:sialidase family protein [Pelagicoccus enzymogenes]MDQ8199398.1 sialidase family protein [Pelagicoccus enzymogenes]